MMDDSKMVDNTALVTFHDGSLDLDVAVSSSENTVWLSLDQISTLFEKDKSTVSRGTFKTQTTMNNHAL